MLGITVGTGRFKEMALHAAARVNAMTGLPVRVLGEQELAASGLPDPKYLRFRLFDWTNDDDVMYFDADMVCLTPWNPVAFRDPLAVVAVRDIMSPAILADAASLGISASDYFNAGLFIVHRSRHLHWLRASEHRLLNCPDLRFFDQSALNMVRSELHLPLRLLDRRFNWVRFGEGGLCNRLPVFMAHRLLPDDDATTLAFYANRYSPPLHHDIIINDAATASLAGTHFTYGHDDSPMLSLFLRSDGTIAPIGNPVDVQYWFIQTRACKLVLTLTSQTDIVEELYHSPDGSWRSAHQLRPITRHA